MDQQNIFFSYSRTDASEFSLTLARDLRNTGANIWIDQLDIRGGENYNEAIENALQSSTSVLFIVSEKSITSKYVLTEVYYALDENKVVIPIIIYETKLPFRLRSLQYIDFSKDYDEGLYKLLNSLHINKHNIGETTSSSNPVNLAAAKTNQKEHNTNLIGLARKKKFIFKAGVSFLLLLVVGWIIFHSASGKKGGPALSNKDSSLNTTHKDSTLALSLPKAIEVHKDSSLQSINASGSDTAKKHNKVINSKNQVLAKTYFAKGQDEYDNGADDMRWEKALTYFTKAIELNPNFSEAYYGRGNVEMALHDYKGAEKDYTKALSLKPTVEGYASRAIVEGELKDYAAAVMDWSEAIKLVPNPGNYIYSRGDMKEKMGDKEGACKDYKKACDLDVPNACKSYQQLCN